MNLRQCGTVDPLWLREAGDVIAKNALASIANLQPAAIGAAQTEVPGISVNRRNGSSLDTELTVCRVEDSNGAPLALIVNFACHPVVLSHENRLISTDYPGELRRILQRDSNVPVLFLTGATGDVNPVFRTDENALEKTAKPLADATGKHLNEITTTSKVLLHGASRRLALPLSNRPPENELIQIAKSDPLPARRAWAEQALLNPGGILLTVDCALTIWKLGPVGLAALGCELFTSLGLQIKSTFAQAGVKLVLIATQANGNLGYVPDAPAYERGGYEVEDAHIYYAQPAAVTPEAGQMILSTVSKLIDEVCD
jgi:hypothetical protein